MQEPLVVSQVASHNDTTSGRRESLGLDSTDAQTTVENNVHEMVDVGEGTCHSRQPRSHSVSGELRAAGRLFPFTTGGSAAACRAGIGCKPACAVSVPGSEWWLADSPIRLQGDHTATMRGSSSSSR